MSDLKQAEQAIAPCVAMVVGRVMAGRRTDDGAFYTQMILPAADAFTPPAYVEVRSNRQLGNNGDDVSVRVRIGGYRRKAYETKPDQYGVSRKVQPVEVTLSAID